MESRGARWGTDYRMCPKKTDPLLVTCYVGLVFPPQISDSVQNKAVYSRNVSKNEKANLLFNSSTRATQPRNTTMLNSRPKSIPDRATGSLSALAPPLAHVPSLTVPSHDVYHHPLSPNLAQTRASSSSSSESMTHLNLNAASSASLLAAA